MTTAPPPSGEVATACRLTEGADCNSVRWFSYLNVDHPLLLPAKLASLKPRSLFPLGSIIWYSKMKWIWPRFGWILTLFSWIFREKFAKNPVTPFFDSFTHIPSKQKGRPKTVFLIMLLLSHHDCLCLPYTQKRRSLDLPSKLRRFFYLHCQHREPSPVFLLIPF